MILAVFHSSLSQIYFFKSVVLWNKWKKENATTLQSKNIWRKKIVKVNIKLSKLRQRPQESGYAESAFLIFGSLSNDDGGGCENVTYSITFNLSNAGGSTRIRYAIYISSLLASRHAQTEPVMWFRGILNLVAILSTMTRRACTLSHQAGTSSPWTNPNRPWRGSEWKRFTRLCLDLKDSII